MFAELARLTAAKADSHINDALCELAAEINVALQDLPLRLRPDDNARRMKAWATSVDNVLERLALLTNRPTQASALVGMPDAQIDETAQRSDEEASALKSVATSIGHAADRARSGALPRNTALAMDLRKAGAKVRELGTVSTRELAAALQDMTRLIDQTATLCMALDANPHLIGRIDAGNLQASREALCKEAHSAWRNELEEIASDIGRQFGEARAIVVVDPDPPTWAPSPFGLTIAAPLASVDAISAFIQSDRCKRLRASSCRTAVLATGEGLLEDLDRGDEDLLARTSLGLGVFTTGGDIGKTLPLLPAHAAEWAAAAGLRFVEDEMDDGPMGVLTNISWSCAQRRLTTLENAEPTVTLLERTTSATAALREWANSLLLPDDIARLVALASTSLSEQIHGEIEGSTESSIFGSTLATISSPATAEPSSSLTEATGVIGVASRLSAALGGLKPGSE